jgi:hypothetical protein
VIVSTKCVSDNAPAWHALAGELADWTLARLANRRDAWGAYHAGGQLTRRGQLTLAHLIRHYQARDAGDILGLHTADADNLSKGGALDVDQHGDDPARAEGNRLSVLHWYDVLARQGFRPLLTASNGRGGFHLRVLLAASIDAARVYHFLHRLSSDHRRSGLDKRPEQFPKQPDLRRCAKQLGSWIRLPGRHYKRAFWSEIWDGSRWLAGHAAIDFMLSLTGDDPALIPDVPSATPKPLVTRRCHYAGSDNLSARIAAYVARLPNLREGEGRDDVAYSFACWLVRDLALDDAIALDWLRRWDSGNSPPKGNDRLAEIVRSAHTYGQRPIGCGLTPERLRYDQHGHRILRAAIGGAGSLPSSFATASSSDSPRKPSRTTLPARSTRIVDGMPWMPYLRASGLFQP